MSIWDFSVIPNYFMSFLDAAKMTVLVTVFGILIGIIFGLILALMRISNYRILSILARVYIWIVRGTPLLLQLLLIYFGLVNIVRIGNLPSAFLALGLHNAAYIAEIFRGSIQGIARGQREAGLSLGMTEGKVMRRIVLPQAFKRAVPSLSNQLIIALKDFSLASAVAIPELLLYARQLGSSTFRLMEMLSIAAIYYLIMTSALTILANGIEKRLNVSDFKVLE